MLPSTTKKQLYNALVLPHMDYCSVVWQECSRQLRQKLERVQNYGMRLILSQQPRTHCEEMRQKLNWMTLEKRRVMARLCMMHRCVLKEYSMESLSKRIQFNSNGMGGVNSSYPGDKQTFSKIHSLSRESKTGIARNLMLEQQSITIPRKHLYMDCNARVVTVF